MPEQTDRPALRRRMRAIRRALTPLARMAGAEAVAHRLLALPFAPVEGYVAGYWAMDGEIALHAWQVQLPKPITYCLPVVCRDHVLRFAPWRAGDGLVSNRYGIPEPDIPDDSLIEADRMSLVVTPLVAFDPCGHRLGMGGGWYDRTFAFRRDRRAPPYLVGAAFADQQVDGIEAEAWDVSLDAVCTNTSTFDLHQKSAHA